jgi:hypothetical protein
MSTKLNELLALWQPPTNGSSTELEIRLKDVTRDAFESLYSALMTDSSFDKPTLECSVNFISENIFQQTAKKDLSQYIRRLLFKGGSVIGDTYTKKTKLAKNIQVNDFINYSIGIAQETTIGKFTSTPNALVRFKLRISSSMIGGKWRIDLTAVKHGVLSDMANTIAGIKKSLFTASLGPDNFIQELNNDLIDHYEIECEYIDQIAPTLEDLNIVKKIFLMINPLYLSEIAYQEEVYHCATFLGFRPDLLQMFKQSTHRLKRLGNQVMTLSKSSYYSEVWPPNGYYLGIKADGHRSIISINGNRVRILRSKDMIEILHDPVFKPGEITIADVEIVDRDKIIEWLKDKKRKFVESGVKDLIRVFDIMVLNDKNVSSQDFVEREMMIEPTVELLTARLPDYKVIKSDPVRLTENMLEVGIREIYEAEYDFPTDGMILTAPGDNYLATKNYKWKPYSHNTIDMLAVKCPPKMLGIKPYEVRKGYQLYILFVGIQHTYREKLGLTLVPQYSTMFPDVDPVYYPIQFSPSIQPLAYLYYVKDGTTEDLNYKIVELSRNEGNTEWVFHKVRLDRQMERNYFGNDYKVAEMTYMNFIDPFNLEDLYTPSESYFTKKAGDIYTAGIKYRRFLVSMLLKNNLSNSKWILDLAAGRGGDLHRYQEIGVEHGLFVDIDPTAIVELVKRKFSFFSDKKKHFNKNGPSQRPMTVHTLVADLKSPPEELIASTLQFGLNPGIVDGVIINFALHYMCDTIEHIRGLLSFIAKMLRVGGLFMFTVMDGRAIFDLLSGLETNQQWESREDGILKYAIKKKYVGKQLTETGQTISVLLPFKDEMEDEPLCNVEMVISEAKKFGFAVELNESMITYKSVFEKQNKFLHDQLTPGDIEYIKLHKYVTLRLVKQITGAGNARRIAKK